MYKKTHRLQHKTEKERRQNPRLERNFILSYFDKARPQTKFELTQLKNIGKGGMCFVTSQKFEPGTKMELELKTPYLAEATYLEGRVLESHEKVEGMLYETRLQFEFLDPKGEFLLAKLIEFFVKGEKGAHE